MLTATRFGALIGGMSPQGRWLMTEGLLLAAGAPLREVQAHSCGGAAPSRR